MGKPLILKGFWNVRRLKKYRQKKLKIGNGGVSGRGIGKKSQEVVRYLSEHTDRHFLIIGAGGIMTAEDAAGMISQGADMIQIYSAFIYSGPSIVHKLGNKLKNELK